MSIIVNPTSVNLSIFKGATFRHSFAWLSGESESAATPVDLTGCTARAQIRETIDSVAPLADMTTVNGGIVLGGVAGTIELYMSDETTAAIASIEKPGYWDLELEWPNGDVTRLLSGRAMIGPEVTRA